MLPKHRAPSHPGEILLHEFLEPTGMSQVDLARKLGIPIQRVNTIVNGRRGVTAETALLLARQFGTTPQFWMNLQASSDLHEAAARLKPVAA
jgi:addiction module HigA family antidote